MNYEQLIETISEIMGNDKIVKEGLTLTYELSEINHRQMNEDLWYRTHPLNTIPVLTDTFEVELDGILIKFLKKN